MQDWRNVLKNESKKLHSQMKMTSDDLKKGCIVYMSLNRNDGLTIDSKYNTRNKFFVIIGVTTDGKIIGSILINTKPAQHNEEILKCQYPLKQANYRDVLEHNSWIDCSEIFSFDKERIIRDGEKRGFLIDEDIQFVINTIRETELIDNNTKKQLGII
jgi:hypothetical protein